MAGIRSRSSEDRSRTPGLPSRRHAGAARLKELRIGALAADVDRCRAPAILGAPRLAVACLLALTTLPGCSATRVKTTWTAPGVQRMHFRKLVAFVIAKDEAVRRNGEHELCERIRNVPCAPAFAVVAEADRGNVDEIARQVEAAGFDGAVVLRYTGHRTQQTYVPRSAPLWGYYGAGWRTAYDPGYVQQDELVDVETAVYSVADRKLLWAGTTESMNPTDVRETVDEIVDAVAAEMRDEGLIPSG